MLCDHVGKRLRQRIQRKVTDVFHNVCSRTVKTGIWYCGMRGRRVRKHNGARDRVLAEIDKIQRTMATVGDRLQALVVQVSAY